MRAMEIIERVWISRNSDEETLRRFSKRVLESERITLGNGFEDAIILMKNLSEIENQEEFYGTMDIVERNLLRRYSNKDYDIFSQFFGYVELLKCDEEFKEIKSFIRTMGTLMEQMNEMYNNKNEKEEEKEMTNTNNENYITETELKRVVQDVATDVELGAMMVQCEALTFIDEDNQKKFIKALCDLSASNADAVVPDYSDDMRSSYYLVVSCINDLIGTSNDLFSKTLVEALDAINKSEYVDDTDRKTVSFVYDYIKDKDVDHAKAVLKVIKLYLSTAYEFIKNYAEQH